METYNKFRPTGFDPSGLGCEDRQDWLVHPCQTNRDAQAATRANFKSACQDLSALDSGDYEIHRFGHWACGWFEIILVRSGSSAAALAEQHESALADYPILNDECFSQEQGEEAKLVWQQMRQCDRIEYIRDNRSDFEFRSFADMLGCARGKYYCGIDSELLS